MRSVSSGWVSGLRTGWGGGRCGRECGGRSRSSRRRERFRRTRDRDSRDPGGCGWGGRGSRDVRPGERRGGGCSLVVVVSGGFEVIDDGAEFAGRGEEVPVVEVAGADGEREEATAIEADAEEGLPVFGGDGGKGSTMAANLAKGALGRGAWARDWREEAEFSFLNPARRRLFGPTLKHEGKTRFVFNKASWPRHCRGVRRS